MSLDIVSIGIGSDRRQAAIDPAGGDTPVQRTVITTAGGGARRHAGAIIGARPAVLQRREDIVERRTLSGRVGAKLDLAQRQQAAPLGTAIGQSIGRSRSQSQSGVEIPFIDAGRNIHETIGRAGHATA